MPCFILIETRRQRVRTQTTAEGDSCRQRTWASEVAEINIERTNDSDMRLCLVADANGASDVVGHAVINLDVHIG